MTDGISPSRATSKNGSSPVALPGAGSSSQSAALVNRPLLRNVRADARGSVGVGGELLDDF